MLPPLFFRIFSKWSEWTVLGIIESGIFSGLRFRACFWCTSSNNFKMVRIDGVENHRIFQFLTFNVLILGFFVFSIARFTDFSTFRFFDFRGLSTFRHYQFFDFPVYRRLICIIFQFLPFSVFQSFVVSIFDFLYFTFFDFTMFQFGFLTIRFLDF